MPDAHIDWLVVERDNTNHRFRLFRSSDGETPVVESPQPYTDPHHTKTDEDLQDEYERWMQGKKDTHDVVIERYKEWVKQKAVLSPEASKAVLERKALMPSKEPEIGTKFVDSITDMDSKTAANLASIPEVKDMVAALQMFLKDTHENLSDLLMGVLRELLRIGTDERGRLLGGADHVLKVLLKHMDLKSAAHLAVAHLLRMEGLISELTYSAVLTGIHDREENPNYPEFHSSEFDFPESSEWEYPWENDKDPVIQHIRTCMENAAWFPPHHKKVMDALAYLVKNHPAREVILSTAFNRLVMSDMGSHEAFKFDGDGNVTGVDYDIIQGWAYIRETLPYLLVALWHCGSLSSEFLDRIMSRFVQQKMISRQDLLFVLLTTFSDMEDFGQGDDEVIQFRHVDSGDDVGHPPSNERVTQGEKRRGKPQDAEEARETTKPINARENVLGFLRSQKGTPLSQLIPLAEVRAMVLIPQISGGFTEENKAYQRRIKNWLHATFKDAVQEGIFERAEVRDAFRAYMGIKVSEEEVPENIPSLDRLTYKKDAMKNPEETGILPPADAMRYRDFENHPDGAKQLAILWAMNNNPYVQVASYLTLALKRSYISAAFAQKVAEEMRDIHSTSVGLYNILQGTPLNATQQDRKPIKENTVSDTDPPASKKTLSGHLARQFKDDAKEIAVRQTVRRGRTFLVETVANFLSKRTNPRREGESVETYTARVESERSAVVAFLLSDAGQGVLSYALGSAWPLLEEQVPEGAPREIGERLTREIRVQGGEAIVDGIYEELVSPLVGFLMTEAKGLGSMIHDSPSVARTLSGSLSPEDSEDVHKLLEAQKVRDAEQEAKIHALEAQLASLKTSNWQV